MLLAGISARSPNAEESSYLSQIEEWLSARAAGLDLHSGYLYARTEDPSTGSMQLHLPLRVNREVYLVIDLDVVSSQIRVGWAIEPDGPGSPVWQGPPEGLPAWRSALERELARRLQVSRRRWARAIDLETSPGQWRSLLPGGRWQRRGRCRTLTLAEDGRRYL